MTSATNAEPMKFFEVSKFIDYWFLAGAGSEWIVVNQKACDALPKDLQQIVMDALKETRLEDKEWEDASACGREGAEAHAGARHDGGRSRQGGDREGAQAGSGGAGTRGSRGPARTASAAWSWRSRLSGGDRARGERGGAPRGLRHARHRAPRLVRRADAVLLQPSRSSSSTSWRASCRCSLIFGGAAYTFRAGGHVRVDLVTELPRRAPCGRGSAW